MPKFNVQYPGLRSTLESLYIYVQLFFGVEIMYLQNSTYKLQRIPLDRVI